MLKKEFILQQSLCVRGPIPAAADFTVVVLKPTLRFIHLGLGEVIVTTQRYTDERGADCFLCCSGGPTDMTRTQQRAHFLLTNTYKCCTVLI